MEQTEKEILSTSQEYAKKRGFSLNESKKILGAVIKGLAKNREKYGKAYCPCRAITGNSEEDKKNICPCIYHLDEIKKDGHCKCQLFFGSKGA